MSKTPIRVLVRFLTGLLCLPLFTMLGPAQSTNSSNDSACPVSASISAKTRTIRAGAQLIVVVTITNNGDGDVILERNTNQELDKFSLSLSYGGKRETARTVGTGDSFGLDSGPPPLRRLFLLEHKQFYGGETVMDAGDFPHLGIPGRYVVTGRYKVEGLSQPGMKTISTGGCSSELQTNSLQIEVRR